MSDITQRVVKIISENLRVHGDNVIPEASFLDDLGGDSLDLVELVMAFEDEFGIAIPDADVERIATVQDAITYVETAQKSD